MRSRIDYSIIYKHAQSNLAFEKSRYKIVARTIKRNFAIKAKFSYEDSNLKIEREIVDLVAELQELLVMLYVYEEAIIGE